tara:strand:- start:559 stop:786 length:228 start_codon:yes stop_codon:yes gene_type:complete
MQIKITANVFGVANASGNATREYKIDEIIDCKEDWQVSLAQNLMDNGFAIETKTVKATEKKVTKKKVAKKKVTKK